MKFFIDTADVKEIREAAEYGLIDGVTTNPSLVAKTGRPFEEVAKEILSLVDGPVSLEVTAPDAAGMVKEALELASWGENAVIKVPMNLEGLKVVRILSKKGIKTNVTLVFSVMQAVLAAKAGASFVSPFVGRLDDISESGMDLIDNIVQIFNNYAFETEVLVASVRHPLHITESALMGADAVTIPYKVIQQLAKHPLTDKGIEAFMKDWDKVPK